MELELAVSVTVCCRSALLTLTYTCTSYIALQIQNRQSFKPGINGIRSVLRFRCLLIFTSCAVFGGHTSRQLMYTLH